MVWTVLRDIKRTVCGVNVMHNTSFYLTKNTVHIHYKDQIAPREDNILRESHQIHRVGKMHKYLSAAKGGMHSYRYARGTRIF